MTPDAFIAKWSGATLAAKNLTYEQVSARLTKIDFRETPAKLQPKTKLGSFSAVFFDQCLVAIGYRSVLVGTD